MIVFDVNETLLDFRILRTNLLKGGVATMSGPLEPYTVLIDPQLGAQVRSVVALVISVATGGSDGSRRSGWSGRWR